MTTKRIERDLNKLFDDYANQVLSYIASLQQRRINPYLEHFGYSIVVGNGTYHVFYTDPECYYGYVSILSERLPVAIKEVLETDVPGLDYNCIGSLMSDFSPPVGHLELVAQGKCRRRPSREYGNTKRGAKS